MHASIMYVLRNGLLIALLGGSGLAVATDLTLEIPYAPSAVPMDEGKVLVYELNVHNEDASRCARLVDVRASAGSGASASLQRFQRLTLAANTVVYTAQMTALPNPLPGEALHAVDIPAGGGAIVYFFRTLATGKPVPTSMRHELEFTDCADDAIARQTLVHESPVSSAPPVVIGLPFSGDGWIAGASSAAMSPHRRTPIRARDSNGQVIRGGFHFPERYAIDWLITDEEARRAVGPLDQNESYLAYGKEIIAVADGVIVGGLDGIIDQTPPNGPLNPTEDDAAGNYLMQDIGGGHYAFYAHLIPGSLRVAVGQRVVRGQVMALLGNTGNSNQPHLHFHVTNGADPLQSEGMPYVFDHYQTTGQIDGLDREIDDYISHDPVPRYEKLPASGSVITSRSAVSWTWAFPLSHCTP